MSESDFSKGLNRVFRRDAIKKSLEENPGQINTNRVREIEGQNFTHELTRALTEQLYVAEADKIKLLEVITQEIRERLQRDDLTLVLLGSAAHGGKEVKNIMLGKNYGDNEVDYALLTDTPITDAEAEMVHNEVSALFIPTAQSLHLERPDSYRPCGFHNAIHERSTNINNPINLAQEIVEAIEDNRQLVEDGILEYSEILDEITRYLVVYLEPSVPPEVNDYNIHQLLQALSLIKDDNPENFYIIKQEIIREWKKVHRLKDKHLAGKKEWADQRTADFVNKVGESSSQAMSKPLEEILDQV